MEDTTDNSTTSSTQVQLASNINDALAQVTSSQLADVQPTDWAFQALQSLVERYGCIAGYPDSTYQSRRKTPKPLGGGYKAGKKRGFDPLSFY